MKRIIIIVVFLLNFVVLISAQKPIKWRSSAKMISQTEGELIIKAKIEPGWHLYGTQIPSGGPKATKFDFSKSIGVAFVGSITPSIAPEFVHDKTFDMKLNWWDKNVVFIQKFKLTAKTGAKIVGSISYMGCNNQTCLPPSSQAINIVVPQYLK